ncbi:hypothetical protein [Synechococcus phage S-B05]|nr:hypothetical protein [Synechococcus phage S-B05]
MRVCNKCGETKEFKSFSPKGKRVDGSRKYSSHCKPCQAKVKKERYSPERKREKDLKSKYGITLNEYDDMLTRQNYKCAICGTDDTTFSNGKRFHVDHCHTTGKVRGLLCGKCNVALGHIGDNIDTLSRMINYLNDNHTDPLQTSGNY